MLSYQHGFHAGNLADVHKHGLLAWMLAYLVRKPKPLTYIETHAGRGLYDLSGAQAAKTGEAKAGIGQAKPWFEDDHPYARVIEAVRREHGVSTYPGSPLLAAHLLRADDTIRLAELHPQEHAGLVDVMAPFAATVQKADGFEMAMSWTPPEPRRGILVCDPPYEVKSDYDRIPDLFTKLHRRWPVGVLVLWYPILADRRHTAMLTALRKISADHLVAEVGFPPARPGHGMTGSGLFVINPPFGLDGEAARLAKWFAKLS